MGYRLIALLFWPVIIINDLGTIVEVYLITKEGSHLKIVILFRSDVHALRMKSQPLNHEANADLPSQYIF